MNGTGLLKYVAGAFLVFGSFLTAPPTKANETVECRSLNFKYSECWAAHLSQPQLVYQVSSAPCILNSTWGFNRKSKYIWVANGCSGVFADVAGYHHGRGDSYDSNARQYDNQGHDVGNVVAGAVLGALVAGMADNHDHSKHKHTTSNYTYSGGYSGCHGVGCFVDNPDNDIDTRPQFDAEGNPNFDEHGNYQGCHGDGCLVDNPDND